MEQCHCGQPLHYTSLYVKGLVEEMIRLHGPTILVTIEGRTWKVPRHYIALHGLKGSEVPGLGFAEATEEGS